MERCDFPLGTTRGLSKFWVRRMLFSIPYSEVCKQLDRIFQYLQKGGISHRDINPGNLLFSEKDKTIKLSDFYWAKTDSLSVGTPSSLNAMYSTVDATSIKMIKDQILPVDFAVRKSVRKVVKRELQEMGRVYRDGSAGKVGKAYHIVDTPYLIDTPRSVNTKQEFLDIYSNITCNPKTVLDVGCAVGYNVFNLMRKFRLSKAYAFEADPIVSKFLRTMKTVYFLRELELYPGVTDTTLVPKVDVVVCMNVHMWLYKQLGPRKTNLVMTNLINNCKELFFQTSGAESAGMYIVKDLKSKEDIEKYLYSLGGREVKLIRSTDIHKGIRHLFKVRGML
jgi:hypothetical protein